MNDRTYVTLLLTGCGAVLIGLVFMVFRFTEPPRSSHHADVEAVSLTSMNDIASRLDDLSRRLDGAPGLGGASAVRSPAAPAAGEILVVWTDATRPFDDPRDSGWDTAPEATIALQVQDQTMPVLDDLSINSMRVRGLTNGREIAWRLEWDDASPEYHLDADLFCDAVGIQFPLAANAAYTMGAIDFPVQIIQWKAIWQKDIDEHFQDVQDLHPNYWVDLYWFADGEFPNRVPDDFRRAEALEWFVANRAGNPMAQFDRRQPAQEMIAEGFGTLTTQLYSATMARGSWSDGTWSVIFSRPMATTDEADYQFAPGTRDIVAFAVWEGSVHNVGGRKQHSQWVVFEVQQ